MVKTFLIVFFFAITMIAVGGNFYWFDRWSEDRGCVLDCPAQEVIIEDKECEAMDCDCPEVDLEFLEWCESLPINQPAKYKEDPNTSYLRYNEEHDIYIYDPHPADEPPSTPQKEEVVNVSQETITEPEPVPFGCPWGGTTIPIEGGLFIDPCWYEK